MTEKILVTAALPYANGPLHFGHIAGAYLPADCYARFQRLKKKDLLFICGSDEYGIAITLSAELAGRTPQQQVDLFHTINQNLFKTLQISFDHYSRTTWPGHVETTHQFFNDLLANGYIEAKLTQQLYSEADQKFLADRYVEGNCPRCDFSPARGDECPSCGASYDATDLKNPRSKLTKSPLILLPTTHWFLKLDQFKERLIEWIKEKQWKPNVVHFIKNYIEDLHPRPITRDLSWGIPIPLPETEGKVLYVWFDAPIGYISATKEFSQKQNDPTLWEKYWLDPATKLVQFIGKDNIPFHASIFPAMIMGQNILYKLVDELPANEFYHLEGRQFSKSEGWFIDLDRFFSRYSSDQIRYTIAANAPETSDSEFTWNEFQQRCNGDLLGKYGNLINRLLVFIQQRCGGIVPQQGNLEPEDVAFLSQIEGITAQIASSYETFQLRKVAQGIMELAQAGNGYFDTKRPWSDAKTAANHSRMYTTLASVLQCVKVLAITSFPIIPTTASKVWSLLGETAPLEETCWNGEIFNPLPAGRPLPQPELLFRKIEDLEIEEEKKSLLNLSRPKSSSG